MELKKENIQEFKSSTEFKKLCLFLTSVVIKKAKEDGIYFGLNLTRDVGSDC